MTLFDGKYMTSYLMAIVMFALSLIIEEQNKKWLVGVIAAVEMFTFK